LQTLSRAPSVAVSVTGPVSPEVAAEVTKSGGCVLEMTSATAACEAIMRLGAEIAVLQVGLPEAKALRLIQLLAAGSHRVRVVAVAVNPNSDLERQIRLAGATCYIPCPASGVGRETLRTLLTGHTTAGSE